MMQNLDALFHPVINETPIWHSLTTYGAFRTSELETICSIEIREEALREMITNTLKLCYLFEPIVKGLEERRPGAIFNPLIKVSDLLEVLKQGLFYRHMVKFNTQNDVTVALVNNRLTQVNVRVISAAIIVFASKRLNLDQIASSMLIFSLEEALLGLRPFGLPLQLSNLQKVLKKIDRIININDLKSYLATSRELKDSNYVEPDQFLFLAAISRKKSVTSAIFFERRRFKYIVAPEINVESQEEKSKEESKVVITEGVRQKVRGLSLHTPSYGDNTSQNTEIFKEIKQCLYKKKRTKSVLLMNEMAKRPRPESPFFRKSVELFQKSERLIVSEKAKLLRFRNSGAKEVRKKYPLKIRGMACNMR